MISRYYHQKMPGLCYLDMVGALSTGREEIKILHIRVCSVKLGMIRNYQRVCSVQLRNTYQNISTRGYTRYSSA